MPDSPSLQRSRECRAFFIYYLYDHLGNTRVTYSVDVYYDGAVDYPTIDRTVESATDYYPYGKALRSFGKERYQSTYHERDVESGFDYRGARFYDGEVVRFNSLDPLAYPSLSDYSYVAGNPNYYIDTDGREFTEAAKQHIATLEQGIGEEIAARNFEINSGGLSDAEVTTFQSEIAELNAALNEITELAKSDVLYDIQVGEGKARVTYDEDKGAVTAVFDGESMSSLGHEVKHLHQFEKGELSLMKVGKRIVGGATYDLGDEVEAYQRGALLGGADPSINEINKFYGHVTMSGHGVGNSMTVKQLFKMNKRRFRLIFKKKPKKADMNKTVEDFMSERNEKGKIHYYNNQD